MAYLMLIFFIGKWNKLAEENGLSGIHFVSHRDDYVSSFIRRIKFRMGLIFREGISGNGNRFTAIFRLGFDAAISTRITRGCKWRSRWYRLVEVMGINMVRKYGYSKIIRTFHAKEDTWENVYSTIVPNWDKTPRTAVYTTPCVLKKHNIGGGDGYGMGVRRHYSGNMSVTH
jgi:hypothetical protein